MFDTRHFILSIEKRECLWNIESPEYSKARRDRDIREQAWRDVAEDITKDWNVLNKQEQNEKIADLKSKWGNIRHYYKRDREIFENDSPGAMKKRRYVFAEILSFLDPVFEKLKNEEYQSRSNCNDNNDSEDNINAEILRLKDFNDEHNSILSSNDEHLASINQTMNDNKNDDIHIETKSRNKSRKRKYKNLLENEILNELKAHQKERINITDNPNALFLLSLVEEMEQMTPIQNLQFKISILDLLKTIKYSSDQPLYTHSENNLPDNILEETPTVSGFNPSVTTSPAPPSSSPAPPSSFSTTTSSVKRKKPNKSTTNSSINLFSKVFNQQPALSSSPTPILTPIPTLSSATNNNQYQNNRPDNSQLISPNLPNIMNSSINELTIFLGALRKYIDEHYKK